MKEIQGVLVDKITSLYKIKELIRENLKNKNIKFVDIRLDKKRSFLPEVKLELNLKELVDNIKLK
jgi:hypothetical protein